MPTTFVLHGSIELANKPDRRLDFAALESVIEDTIGMDEDVYIADSADSAAGDALYIDIDTNEASHSAYERVYTALQDFLTKHAATGGVFTLEDDDFWVFGPTPLARWQAHFNHLQDLATAADERLGAWVEANPAPEA